MSDQTDRDELTSDVTASEGENGGIDSRTNQPTGGVNAPRVKEEGLFNLDLSASVDATPEEIALIGSGSAGRRIEEVIEVKALKEMDTLDPVTARGMRPLGSMAKLHDNLLDTTMNGVARGVLYEGNTGANAVTVVPHTWHVSPHTNTVDGSYRVKALSALEIETTQFDAAFYRMNRRDPDQLLGYLVSYLTRDDTKRYASFLQEALSHMSFQKVVQRNLLFRDYGELLDTNYRVVDPPDPGDDDDWIEERGVRINRNIDPPEVVAHPNFGIMWPGPGFPGPPGEDAEVKIVPADEVMIELVPGALAADGQNVFVSRANTPAGLAVDLIALFCGTRPEFGIYGLDVTIVLATMRKDDYSSIMRQWGLRPDRSGSLRDLAHFLWGNKGFGIRDGLFTSSGADFLRVRDYLAVSNSIITAGNEVWRRVIDLVRGLSVSFPYAQWQLRLCIIYNILDWDSDVWAAIRGWESFRTLALMRGVQIGASLDVVSQLTVGSRRNLARFPGVRSSALLLQVALTAVFNWGWSKGRKQLCYRVDWLANSDDAADYPNNRDLIINDFPAPNPAPTADNDAWWIEVRNAWCTLFSPDTPFHIKNDLKPFRSCQMKRFGANILYTKESEMAALTRLISLMGGMNVDIQYRHNEVAATVARRIRWTNDTFAPMYVYWHDDLDKVIGYQWESNDLMALELRNEQIGVSFNSSDFSIAFEGMGLFSGLGDLSGLGGSRT